MSTNDFKIKILNQANDLLNLCHTIGLSKEKVPKTIKSLNELKSNIFIFIYENICNTELIDKKRACHSDEDESDNIQAVIDSLSLDVLHEDLSHLTGESIINTINSTKPTNYAPVSYLLDILKSIHEWITSKPENNNNSGNDEFKIIEPISESIEPVKVKEQEIQKKEAIRKQENIFKEYMQQKEQEFKLNKQKEIVAAIEANSSSGNSSFESTDSYLNKIKDYYHQQQQQQPMMKQVKFENNIQTINNELNQMRLSLKSNLNLEQNKIDKLLQNVYADDLKDARSLMRQSLMKQTNKSNLTDQLYHTAFNERPKSQAVSLSSRSKGVLIQRPKKNKIKTRRSVSLSSLSNNTPRFTIGENGILSSLLEEFPYLYTAPETIHYLWSKHSKQIETFSKLHKDIETKYLQAETATSTKLAEFHLNESYKKQEMLMDIMRKDLQHLQRIQDLKRKTEVENSMKSRQREQRFQTAKVKRYYEEFRLQQRAKMLKKTTGEELVFKKLFNESLKIQKERLLELKRYAKEKSELNTKEQLNQIKSIENFYKNKFDLLNEQLNKDREETMCRDKAQHLVLSKMKLQVKKKLETDIRDLQDQMAQDKDSVYWREMDAKRIQQELYSANYYKPIIKKKV